MSETDIALQMWSYKYKIERVPWPAGFSLACWYSQRCRRSSLLQGHTADSCSWFSHNYKLKNWRAVRVPAHPWSEPAKNEAASHTCFMKLVSGRPRANLWEAVTILPVTELYLLGWWSTGDMNTTYVSEKLGKLCNAWRWRNIAIPLKPFSHGWYTGGLCASLWSWQIVLAQTNDQDWLSLKG